MADRRRLRPRIDGLSGLGGGVLGVLRRRVSRRTRLFDDPETRPGLVATMLLGVLPGSVLERLEITRRDVGMIARQLAGYSSPTLVKAHPRLPAPRDLGSSPGTASTPRSRSSLNGAARVNGRASPSESYIPPGPDRLQPSSRPAPARARRPSTLPPRVKLDPDAPALETRAGPSPLAVRELVVTKVVRETPDAVSLSIDDPSGRPIDYKLGQFLTLILDVAGQEIRRPYSFSTSPYDGRLPALTIKRIPGGQASTHLVENVRENDTLRAIGPSGAFTATPDPRRRRHLVMLAGGSGITPIMSILRGVLAAEPESRVTLVYGNRSERDIIFRYALDALAFKQGGRLVIDHVLSDPTPGWEGPTGLLDRKTVMARLRTLAVQDDDDTEYYLCGPDPMLEGCRDALDRRNVPSDRIFEERYVKPEVSGGTTPDVADRPVKMKVTRAGAQALVTVAPGQSLLDAGLAAGVDMPFSCTMGGCGACRVKLVAGEVSMAEPNCLRADEREAGYTLACSSYPKGPVAVEVDG